MKEIKINHCLCPSPGSRDAYSTVIEEVLTKNKGIIYKGLGKVKEYMIGTSVTILPTLGLKVPQRSTLTIRGPPEMAITFNRETQLTHSDSMGN